MRGVEDPVERLKALEEPPHGIIIHKAYETPVEAVVEQIKAVKDAFEDRLLVGVQGDVTPETIPTLIQGGADIAIVSRYVTQSRDVTRTVRDLLNSTPKLKEDIDLLRVHIE
ncbi:MAG: hypothetical protein QW569_06950, partial [Candidatus Bathyarchaeia archaeon]